MNNKDFCSNKPGTNQQTSNKKHFFKALWAKRVKQICKAQNPPVIKRGENLGFTVV
jgi:hypothetical protein